MSWPKAKWEWLLTWEVTGYDKTNTKYRLLFRDDMTESYQYMIQYCDKGKMGEDVWMEDDTLKYHESSATLIRHLMAQNAHAVAVAG